jgi:hypothetical protein
MADNLVFDYRHTFDHIFPEFLSDMLKKIEKF